MGDPAAASCGGPGLDEPAIIHTTTQLYADAAMACGSTSLDDRGRLADVVTEHWVEAVHGATGYDLLGPGHEVIEQMLSEWIDRIGVLDYEDARQLDLLAA